MHKWYFKARYLFHYSNFVLVWFWSPNLYFDVCFCCVFDSALISYMRLLFPFSIIISVLPIFMPRWFNLMRTYTFILENPSTSNVKFLLSEINLSSLAYTGILFVNFKRELLLSISIFSIEKKRNLLVTELVVY